MGEEGKIVELDDNPFSFKHFLKNQIGQDGSQDGSVASTKTNDTEPKYDDVKDVTEEIPFPDVHQDHEDLLVTKKKAKGKKTKQVSNKKQELHSPDDDNPFSFKNFVKKDVAVKTSGRVLQIVDDEICEVANYDNSRHIHDLIEDGLKAELQEDMTKESDEPKMVSDRIKPADTALKLQQNFDEEITKLKIENKKLKKELKEAIQLKEEESKKVATLSKKLKEMEQKENEETAALEKMVHMVEKNLELTTQRALKAEALTGKLREENKILKINSVSKAIYDDLVNRHHSSLASIKDQATAASQHLNATAAKAEESLKQLYSGVDSFKLVSEVLRSIDKFTSLHEGSQS